MKIQNLALIFLIIVVPMILLLTFYNQIQAKSLSLQLQYDTKLSDATHDAIKAFELNTVTNIPNNDTLSQVADSLKRNVQASVNVFLSSMAKSMGISGATADSISEYVPATVFTLYDGYYIYAPSYAEVLDDAKDVQLSANGGIFNKDGTKPNSGSGDYVEVTKELSKDQIYVCPNCGCKFNKDLVCCPDCGWTSGFTLEAQTPEYTYKHMLQPYVYYTVRYQSGLSDDFIVNYSLDNYITVYGTIGGKYVTKAGYLVVPGSNSDPNNNIIISLPDSNNNYNNNNITVTIDQNKLFTVLERDMLMALPNVPNSDLEGSNSTDANIDDLFRNIHKDDINDLNTPNADGTVNIHKTGLVSAWGEDLVDAAINVANGSGQIPSASDFLVDLPISQIDSDVFSTGDQISIDSGSSTITRLLDCIDVKYNGVGITDPDAKAYYIKALQFTNWVNKYLGNVTASQAVDANGAQYSELDANGNPYYPFQNDTTHIFQTSATNDPDDIASPFTQHKIEFIKASIKASLASAIARYNQYYFTQTHEYSIKMPELTQTEWSTITNNVSMITFMQGMIIGNKIYNGYSVVASTDNTQMVNTNQIYYFDTSTITPGGTITYHRFDCTDLPNNNNIIGFSSTEFQLYATQGSDGNNYYTYGLELGDWLKQQTASPPGGPPDQEIDISIDLSNSDSTLWKTGLTATGSKLPKIIFQADYKCIVSANYQSDTLPNMNTRLYAKYEAIARERNRLYKVNDYFDAEY
ncbi:MAG: hypothetical protein FWF46_00275 [Oscillospiraceae bacterium]|nr:hypothetical protein [Oscillospiraceae bacterium]